MDLSTAIATAGAQLGTDAVANLTAVAPIALLIIGAFAGFRVALKAFRSGSKG